MNRFPEYAIVVMVSCRTAAMEHLGSLCLGLLLSSLVNCGRAAEPQSPTNQTTISKPLTAVLTPQKWQQVENAVDHALANLAWRQATDGLFSKEPLGPDWQRYEASHTAIYNHAIAGMMLGEAYGQVSGARAKLTKQAIENGLQFTRELQLRRKAPADTGGWRYLRVPGGQPQADLSITSWQLMFMRSAKNAHFNVPQGYVDEAMAYVHRCFDPQTGMFHYALSGGGGFGASRGMASAGILSLSLAGQHQTPMAQAAGDWLLAHPYRQFGEVIGSYDKFFYSTYYCSQAMAQLGGHYWEKFFPPMVEVLLKAQFPDGSWPPEQALETAGVSIFGNALSTALAVLSLTPPYQLLPV